MKFDFLCIATCFLRGFQQTKRLKNLQMFLAHIKNIFVEKNIFSLIFVFCHQFFFCYKTFDLKTWRKELNLQNQAKNVPKI